MIPLLKNALETGCDCITQLQRQKDFFTESSVLTELTDAMLIRDVEIGVNGLMLYPVNSPYNLLEYLTKEHSLTFTREKNEDGSYDWVSIWATHDVFETEPFDNSFAIWIVANEVVDLTGTRVTKSTTQPTN